MGKKKQTSEVQVEFTQEIYNQIMNNALVPMTKAMSESLYPHDTKFPNDIHVWEGVAYMNYRVRALREENGLTQTEMAEVLGVSQREYWRFEQFDHSMQLTTFCRIALFFNVSMDWLLGASSERKPLLDNPHTVVHGFNLQDMKQAKAEKRAYTPEGKR